MFYSIGKIKKLATLLLMFFTLVNGFCQQVDRSYQITLPTRSFIPPTGINDSTQTILKGWFNTNKSPYVLLQLKKTPTRSERDQLKTLGVQLISYVGGNTWYAKIKDPRVLDFENSSDQKMGLIRWIGSLEKTDRMGKYLKEKGFPTWSTLPNNKVKLKVDFFKDISKEEARQILFKYNATIENEHRRSIGFNIIISQDNYLNLLNEENIRLIENEPAPDILENNGARAWTNTNQVQVLGIDGTGVVVGIWDGNEVDDLHNDLNGRVTFGETPRSNITSEHATHVAGIIGGNGTNARNNRGHAPGVQILSFDFGNAVNEMIDASANNNLNISNNSFGTRTGWYFDLSTRLWRFQNNQNAFGDYTSRSGDLDDIVRTDNVVVVFSAGNDRNNPTVGGLVSAMRPADSDQGTGNSGYGTLNTPKSAKNIITVGAIDDATSRVTAFSNWGPTDDGRVKPDLVAPGFDILSTDDDGNDGDVEDINNQYITKSGTSMAAPAVSGIAALLVQAYRETFNTAERPLASTIKALLIHGARDLGTVGPDFQYGWGGVDAEAAYNLINDRLFLASEFRETGQEDVFFCEVPSGATTFNATIAWSDIEALANCNPCLVNDLDLWLEDPDGNTFTPWKLDPSPTGWADGASRHGGADHINNVEQVSVLNPTPGRWKVHIKSFAVNAPVDDPQQKYTLVSDFPFIQDENVSVIQVLDRTGSMGFYGYMEPAKIAVQNFIGLMNLGDEVGVVAFDDEGCDDVGAKAEPMFSLQRLNTESDKDLAISTIDPITSRGCTSIGGGLELAQTSADFLGGADPENPHAMILLTDGFENTTPWVETRPEAYATKPATPNNILSTIPDKTQIFTIALGTTADTDLLEKIANETRGKFYESPTVAALLSIYYQIRSNIDETEMSELVMETATESETVQEVFVDEGSEAVTFALGWLQPKASLFFEITDPKGNIVQSNYLGANIITKDGFTILKVLQPLSGTWKAKISKNSNRDTDIDYTFASFISGRSLLTNLLPTFTRSGDCLLGKVRLKDQFGKAILGANISVDIQSPKRNKYTQHFNLIQNQWTKKGWASGVRDGRLENNIASSFSLDPISNWALTLRQANAQNIKETGQTIFQNNIQKINLYDDGTNGDELANDGIYSYCFKQTEVAGNYYLNFSINDSNRSFKRKIIATHTIKPAQVDPQKSYVKKIEQQGKWGIVIAPMDQYGNILGAGISTMINISPNKGQLIGKIIDRGDGIYLQEINKDAFNSEIKIEVNGIVLQEKKKRLGISIHAGKTFPIGAMENTYASDQMYEINLEYRINNNWSLESLAGRYQFQSNDQIDALSLSLKRYSPSINRFQLFGALGLGGYKATNEKLGLGALAGLGINAQIRPNLYLDLGGQYHQIFQENKIQFWTLEAGLHYFFF